jgi:hypothetical protein
MENATRWTLDNSYATTDLNVTYVSNPVYTGGSETDGIYRYDNGLPDPLLAHTYCDDPISHGSRCDQLYIEYDATEICQHACNHVVTARVADETGIVPDRPPGPEYAVHRRLTLLVDDDLHQGPGGPDLPATLTIGALGWLVKEDGAERIPMAPSDGPRLEVGERYLIAIVDYGQDGWGYLTASSAFHLVDDRVETEGYDTDARSRVAEIGLDRLAAELADTPIDADARPFLALPAPERFEAAYAAEAAREAESTEASAAPPVQEGP